MNPNSSHPVLVARALATPNASSLPGTESPSAQLERLVARSSGEKPSSIPTNRVLPRGAATAAIRKLPEVIVERIRAARANNHTWTVITAALVEDGLLPLPTHSPAYSYTPLQRLAFLLRADMLRRGVVDVLPGRPTNFKGTPSRDFCTVREAAVRLGVTPALLKRLIRDGLLRGLVANTGFSDTRLRISKSRLDVLTAALHTIETMPL